MPPRTLTEGDFQEIKRLYTEEELSQTEIARIFGVTQPAIHKYLKMMGIATRRTWAGKTRICRGECGEELPVSEFYKKDYVCKKCRPKYNRRAGFDLQGKYNITRNEYELLLRKQNGRCAICGKTQEDNGRELAVDHNHETGAVRGLLCANCNTGIGLLGDDVEILYNAIKYLRS